MTMMSYFCAMKRSPQRSRGGQGAMERFPTVAAPIDFLLRVEAVFDFLPVDHVPPGGQVIRTPVLVLQIICVLPHIAAEHRRLALHDRAVLVGRRRDLHRAPGL